MSAALQHPMIGPYTVEDWLALDPSVDGSRLEDQLRSPMLTAYRLEQARYVEETTVQAGATATITAAPIPVDLDPLTSSRR